MIKPIRVALVAVSAPITLAVAQAPTSTTASVPVAKVVLFSSGVGYFEHAGIVHGNSATQLRFKTSQINDILKSLMLQDQDGGHVGAVTYPSQDPLTKTLKSFQVDITQNPSQAELLNQLRGARVTLQARQGTLSGVILGVETQRRTSEKGEASQVAVLNLFTGASIRAIELPSISSLSLQDEQLQDELTKALSALVQARDQDKKPVTISFTGTGDRHVRIGYVVETPIWKTSYRLILGDKGTSGKLQGWAIVENQTESDWNNVSLNLVSGRPISFTMDLYQPLYSTRPMVAQETMVGVRPQIYFRGSGTVGRVDSLTSALRRFGYGPDGKPLSMQMNEAITTASSYSALSATADPDWYVNGSVAGIAETARLGELFQYAVGNVALARQKSAMLPIITDSVQLERMSIYNGSVLGTNPLNGVLFRNTSGKHLLQGPVTVLDGGGYVGDARIDNVPPGQSRLLSYGIDLDVTVDANHLVGASRIQSAKVSKGMMLLSRKLEETKSYVIDNKGDKSKVIVIEHPVRRGWKLVDTQEPYETTASHYRFRVKVGPNVQSTLTVKEELVQTESLAMVPMDVTQLVAYTRTSDISASVRNALGKAIQLKQEMVDLDRQIAVDNQRVAEISTEQARIRENMKTVEKSGQYYDRLLAKLNEQESQIEKLQADRASLTTRRDGVRKELEEYLNALVIA